MPTVNGIMPLFIVSELDRAVDFYTSVMGFELRLRTPENQPFFAIVGRGGTGIMLKHVSPDVPPLPNPERHEWAKWDAFVNVPDPEALAAECSSRAAGISFDVHDTDDGLRGFEISDLDGYVLFFGHSAGS